MNMLKMVTENPILAILRNIPLEDTIPYADAVVHGGVRFFEVAMNSKDGETQIKMLRDHFGNSCLIGAGTAVSKELCKRAVDAGAQFLLTPGTPREVLEYCAKEELQLLPGVLTPTDVAVSLLYGFETMKLFPADCMGEGYVKSLKGPYDQTNYVAIGGVTGGNIQKFLRSGYLGVGMSSALMPKECMQNKDWDQGTNYIKKMVSGIR